MPVPITSILVAAHVLILCNGGVGGSMAVSNYNICLPCERNNVRNLGDETSFPACISVVKGESKTDCQINTPASESVVGVVPMPTDVYIIDTKPAGFKIYFNLKSSELTENKELMLGIYKLEESTTECYIYNFSQCDHRQVVLLHVGNEILLVVFSSNALAR
ncbi:uncharacterized protein LOC102807786 [Saccoglossus kowalevskii]